jgi:hypothetical protein
MNQLAAMRDTLTLAHDYGMPNIDRLPPTCDYWHLQDMIERAQTGGFSEAKLGRWLGWMQCAVVAAGIGATLDDMRRINRRHAEGD